MNSVLKNRVRLCLGAALTSTLILSPLAQGADAPAATPQADTLEEVIVTATKREEKVRSVSASVSAVSGTQLESAGAQSYADYIATIPGAVFNSYQPGVSHVTLRGIATTSGNTQGQGTTGYYVNDVPLSEPGWTIVIPDIDTFDVSRVEVLRGPQGTLFGAASMGGAVNTIVNVADTKSFDAAVEGDLSSTHGSGSPNYSIKGMVNLPLITDQLGLRLVGYDREEAGYLDNVLLGKKDSNAVAIKGGRASLTWTPTETTKLSWLSMVQQTNADDNSYEIKELGDLKRESAVPEFVDTRVTLHSLRLDQELPFATLTGLASYGTKSQHWQFDYTPYESAYNSGLGLNLTAPLWIQDGGDSTNKTIELRLASPSGGRQEWLVGGMYYKSDKNLSEVLGAQGAAAAFDQSSLYGPGSGAIIAPDGQVFNAFYTKVAGSEKALFGEYSYHFVPAWKLTLGGRLFRTAVSQTSTEVGFSTYPGSPIVTPSSSDDSGFSPKAALTWTPSNDVMVYGLVSKGFRFGSPNAPGLSTYTYPSGSKSDKLINYELGTRTNWLNDTLQLDATLFYVDWTDIQLRLSTPDYIAYSTNGGSATSKGVEFTGSWHPVPQLTLGTSVTYTDATLTEPLLVLYYGTVPKGTQLPGSSKWIISNTASWRFPGQYEPTLQLAHVGMTKGYSDLGSVAAGAPNTQGDYDLFNARLSGKIGHLTVSLYVNNLTDERGVTRSVSEVYGTGQGLVQPRTIGTSLYWKL